MPAPRGAISCPSVDLFGLNIAAVSFDAAVEALVAAAQCDDRARVAVTPNVDHLVRLADDPDMMHRYRQADFIFADGMPLVWASRPLGRPLPGRVTGADLYVELCRQAQDRGWKVVMLGGTPGQKSRIEAGYARCYPRLKIEVISPGMGFDPYGPEAEECARRVREAAPQVVFVCLGMPRQENWAFRYAGSLPRGVVLCAGISMLYAIGMLRRAPGWIQRAGLEWLWRLASEPGRLWRRYLVDDPRFLGICWRQWRDQRRGASR